MPADHNMIEQRVATLESAVGKIEQAVSSIAQSMQALVRLEERHSQTQDSVQRCFAEIGDHEKRLRELEKSEPVQKLVSGWVIGGIVTILSLIITALLGMVLMGAPRVTEALNPVLMSLPGVMS